MRNLVLEIMYDGRNYHGYCRQPGLPTVQAEIEKALFKLTGKKIGVTGAGRTDAGVHAEGQVVNFKTESKLPLMRIKAGLNAYLPTDIRIIKSKAVAEAFHARFSAKAKRYIYSIFEGDLVPYFLVPFTYRIRPGIDLKKLKRAAMAFTGKHNFTAFASEAAKRNPVKTIYTISVRTKKYKLGRLIELEFVGNGFLYKMVRHLVGAMIEVGKGKVKLSVIKKNLKTPGKVRIGKTVPGHGLRLSEVIYK
ncbi:tRNA pseudouridine(38-40) synthase TruA [Candidatus Margulisiibacteriota bacterium]